MIENPSPPTTELIVHREWPLDDGYSIKLVHRFEEPLFKSLVRQFFYEDLPGVDLEKVLQPAPKKAFEFPNRIRLAAYRGDEFVGWTTGWQENETVFQMANSGVLPEHRRKGIYSRLLAKQIELARDEGYQVIRSNHIATNNAVIVPKLKAGFVITGMKLRETFGTLVELSLYLNDTRRELVDVRAGLRRPGPELAAIISPKQP